MFMVSQLISGIKLVYCSKNPNSILQFEILRLKIKKPHHNLMRLFSIKVLLGSGNYCYGNFCYCIAVQCNFHFVFTDSFKRAFR